MITYKKPSWRKLAWLFFCICLTSADFAFGLPYTPGNDAEILQAGLPTRDPRMREIRSLSATLRERPEDRDIAMRLAQRQLAMGVGESDPRFVGYAQAALSRWWADPQPDIKFLLLRARILQAEHSFAAAQDDLHAALLIQPSSQAALFILASVDEVMGDLAEAKQACETFSHLRAGLTSVACLTSVDSLTGNAAPSYAALLKATELTPSTDREIQLWALTMLGEIASRIGIPTAGQHFKEALALDDRNVYTLTVYADYLLQEGRASDVLDMLTGFERIDALYLRYALAAKATKDPRFDQIALDLGARFAAARRQGDTLHLRDAARFALEIEGNPLQALDFARQNWQTQKAPIDALILLEAALASHSSAAAQPVADWVGKTHLEDVHIHKLLEALHVS